MKIVLQKYKTISETWLIPFRLFCFQILFYQVAGNKKHAKGIQEGTVTIIATSTLGISGTAQLKVSPSELEYIKITPKDLSVHLGHVQQFTATGIFSDGKQKDSADELPCSF